MSAITTETGLRESVLALADELAGGAGVHQAITLERPPRADFGDYSTNAALLLAPTAGAPPRELAQRLGEALVDGLGDQLQRFEVAGPGFLNLFLSDAWHRAALAQVLEVGEGYGRGGALTSGGGALTSSGRTLTPSGGTLTSSGGTLTPERILVEFVSANPTGPMHVGHARNAAYGDALARVLAFHGHAVRREFYVNNAGSQVQKLGESIIALMQGKEVPEDGYHGDYVHVLAERIGQRLMLSPGEQVEPRYVGDVAVEFVLAEVQELLASFGVKFDHWTYESTLHKGAPSPVDHTLELLEQSGHTYRSEGALWLRTTEYGDDKDRVLVRSSGEHTYFSSDIAYHQDKRERGFERQIDVWGADHHGYVARMKGAYEALGGDPGHLEMLIMQLVHLVRRGERAQMSKRSGEFVTLEDLLREIGVDAARWFLLSRSHDTTIDLDLDLAREQSSDNPVYYVQYAHARIASVLAKAGGTRVEQALEALTGDAVNPEELHLAERTLVKKLLAFPGEVREAAVRRAPHRIAAYALELAQQFTAFYRDCRVLGAESPALESQRLALCVASLRTIASSLDLLGVTAPDEM